MHRKFNNKKGALTDYLTYIIVFVLVFAFIYFLAYSWISMTDIKNTKKMTAVSQKNNKGNILDGIVNGEIKYKDENIKIYELVVNSKYDKDISSLLYSEVEKKVSLIYPDYEFFILKINGIEIKKDTSRLIPPIEYNQNSFNYPEQSDGYYFDELSIPGEGNDKYIVTLGIDTKGTINSQIAVGNSYGNLR